MQVRSLSAFYIYQCQHLWNPRFFSSCTLAQKPIIVSWMLTNDFRFLLERKEGLLFLEVANSINTFLLMSHAPFSLNILSHSYTLQERNSALKCKSFVIDSKCSSLYSRRRFFLYLLGMFDLHTSKNSWSQASES